MKCPHPKTLSSLLVDGNPPAEAATLWKHLEECPRCRCELDRISDDPELQHWRDTGSSSIVPESEVDALAVLVERLANSGSTVHSIDTKSTTADDSVDDRIIASFEPSVDPNDLGSMGQYRIRRLLGHGGMAMVFEAIDTDLDRVVALKILRTKHSDASSRDRFIREARALAGLKHPNVISIYSVSSNSDGQPFIAMEMVHGGSVQEVLKRDQETTPRLAAQWIAEVANGLAAAHDAGLIHRDIKPSNILLSEQGSSFVAKLADFGLARFTNIEHRATQTGILLGTPAYMSPEHIATPDQCDPLSDIYSLGVTLYEMLTGEPPFRGAVHTVLQRIGRDEPALPRSLNALIPRDLETICMKAMQREPKRRYATAKAFSEDLNRWLSGQAILARPATRLELFLGWCRRNRSVASLTGATIGLLVVLATVSTYSAITIRSTDQDLRKEKEMVEATSRQLQVVADDAKKQRQIAIEALNSLVTKVQSELVSRPGTFKLREAILEAAIKGLDQITEDSDSTEIDLVRIQAHIRKGEIFDSLGRASESVVELEKASAFAETLVKGKPDSVDALRELCNALMAQADVATRRGGFDIAMPLYQRVLPIREAAAANMPKDFNTQRALALVVQRIADIHFHRSEWDVAQVAFTRSRKITSELAANSPESLIAKRDLAIAESRLGNIESLRGQFVIAEAHFKNAIEINRALLIAEPENKIFQGDLGFISTNLARLVSSRGEHADAVLQARQAIEYLKAVSVSDPNDTDAKMKLGGGWLAMHDIQFAAGNLIEAEKAMIEGIAIDMSLSEVDPSATKFSMHGADMASNLASLQLRLGKLAESLESVRQSIRFLTRCKKAADSKPEVFDPMIASQRSTEAAIQWVLSAADKRDANLREEPDFLYRTQIIEMYEAARTANTDKALQLGKLITENPAKDPALAHFGEFIVARAYAQCYGHLSKQIEPDKKTNKEELEIALQGTIVHLKPLLELEIVIKNPSLRVAMKKERDFAAIQDQTAFMALFQ